jgi:tripartite-type tricarboxylate transporter receptor subunit TctC
MQNPELTRCLMFLIFPKNAYKSSLLKSLPWRLLSCALGLFFTAISGMVLAQPFPNKTITIVVPTSAGGANDAMARILAQGLSLKLGQAVIVENKPGGNGGIASEYVAKSSPDGYTILFGYIATHGINPALQKIKYDPINDFEPIGMVGISPTILVVNPDLPVQNAKELVTLLKANPDAMSYGSAGRGTAPHLAGELFQINTGTKMVHVPYKGSAPAMFDVMGGTIQIMFPSVFTAFPQVKAGKLRPLGVAGEKRLKVMPNLPTLTEQGIPNMSVTQWYALFAPAKTPQPIIELLNKNINSILSTTSVQKKFEDQGSEVEISTPAELKALVQSEIVRWKKLIDAAKISAD